MKNLLSFMYFFVCASLLFSITALAYIDPSAMTYIIQLVAGIAIAGGAAFGFYFRKLKRKLSGLGKGEEVQYQDAKDDDEVGLGDYEIEGSMLSTRKKAPTKSSSKSNRNRSAQVLDPYDETGGES